MWERKGVTRGGWGQAEMQVMAEEAGRQLEEQGRLLAILEEEGRVRQTSILDITQQVPQLLSTTRLVSSKC